MSALEQVAAALEPSLAEHAIAPSGSGRFEGRLGDTALEFVLEAVYEGQLVHSGQSRILELPDPDLAILAGDSLFALGLERLAKTGNLAAVAELADVIALCAWASASGRDELEPELWDAAADALASPGAPGVRAVLERLERPEDGLEGR